MIPVAPRTLTTLLTLTALWLTVSPRLMAQDPAPGMARLYRLDLLPCYHDSTFVGAVTSYDRSGGNNDGFSGQYSFVAKEEGGLVLADLEGPGVIYRIWTPTPTDDMLEFYFDGETKPRIRVRFRDLFTGTQPPFVSGLSGYGAGGFYCYVPLGYEKRCKIVAKAERIQFYQINYARYDSDAGVRTWSPALAQQQAADQAKAQQLIAATGGDITPQVAPPGSQTTLHSQSVSLAPGSTATLFESTAGGRIVGLRIAPASALAGKDRALVLRMTWDGADRPAVECPAGDFFGFAWGQPATRSLLVGTHQNINYCYFPMPFKASAKIELVSQRTAGPPVELRAEVVTCPVPRGDNEGAFCAVWRRENPTTDGVPFTFVKTEGRGHLVGCIVQAQGMHSGVTPFFEGDDQTTIDGELTIHGTGSEDFFNGGWYDVPDRWEKQISFPLSGCLGYQKHLGRTGGYRIMLGDAYAFRHSILQTIEHAPTENKLPTDHTGVTYLYLDDPAALQDKLPPAAQRAVVDITELVFTPAWSVPVRAFSFRNATLGKLDETIADEKVAFLRLAATTAGDWFGVPFVSLECDFAAAGNYQVTADLVRGPAQGKLQLFRNEVPVGEVIDMYSADRELAKNVPLGTITVDEGPAALMFKMVGKNDAATSWSLDLAKLYCRRVE